MNPILEKVLLALIPAVFAFIPAVLNWLSNRASTKGRVGRVALLSNELKFLEQWAGLARTQSAGDAASAVPATSLAADLDRILLEYRAIKARDALADQQPEQVSRLRRALLLFRPLSFKGWLLHTGFYFLAIFAAAMIVSEIVTPTVNESGESELWPLIIGVAILFGPVLWLMRRTAVRLRDQQIDARDKGPNAAEQLAHGPG